MSDPKAEKYVRLNDILALIEKCQWQMDLSLYFSGTLNVVVTDKFRGYLSQLPTTEIKEWIPVSERLPEEDTEVLVTVFFRGLDRRLSNGMTEHYKPNTYVEIASQVDGEWTSESDEDKVAPTRHIVTAWMPLPKSYEDKNEDKTKLVHCKDCKHFSDGDCTELPKTVSEDDFCSFAEHKEGEGYGLIMHSKKG